MENFKGDIYLKTVNIPCQFCGETWHKHRSYCPNYHKSYRCSYAHTPFLRSIDFSRGEFNSYEYECSFCNIASVFTEEIKNFKHPLCYKDKHYWDTCSSGCCVPSCIGCGKKGTLIDLRDQIRKRVR